MFLRILILTLMTAARAFAADGAEGILTYLHARCVENVSAADHKLMTTIMIDDQNLDAFDSRRTMHVTQLALEKSKCLHSALTAFAFGKTATIDDVEHVKSYRTILAQLALYQGAKETELRNLVRSFDCKQDIQEDKDACLLERKTTIVQEHAMLSAVQDFMSAYAKAADGSHKVLLNTIERKVESKLEDQINALAKKSEEEARQVRRGKPNSNDTIKTAR